MTIQVLQILNILRYSLALKGNGNKNFIVLFERDSKTIYRSLLQNFYIGLIWCEIFLLEIFSCRPSWIFVDMHGTSQLGSRIFFLTTQ